MSSSTTVTSNAPSHVGGFNQGAFDAFIGQRGEPSWLVDRRREALGLFQSAAWPTLRDEEWRRTDIRMLKLAAFAPPSSAPSDAARASLSAARDTLAANYGAGIAHVDGSPVRTPDRAPLPDGVVFTDFATALKSHPEILQKYLLNEAVRPNEDVFSALHAAFWTGGTLLYVPKGVKLDVPLFSLVGLSPEGTVDLHHTLVVLEEGAEATLVQEAAAGTGRAATPALHAGAVELFVGNGAKLQYVNIQNWDNHTWHLSRERALVGREGSVQWTIGGLGSRLAKVNQEVVLNGQKARAQVNGVMFTTGKQNLTYLTRQDHVAPQTSSDLLYKAGLKENSRVVWKGMIRVEPGAQRTDAYQKNDNLVLSDSSRADSIPGLEIEANDVRCTHGATAGRVDENMIFYLRSRGIKREEAVRLIVEGFFANVYDRIALEPVRETLKAVVATKLDL